MYRLRLFIAAAFLVMSSNASAVYIVDTGAGTASPLASLNRTQFLAGQFMTLQDWRIESVEGFIDTSHTGTLTAVIYDDSIGSPGTELFSKEFTVNALSSGAWEGALGLDWLLPAGTYWAAFEVRASQADTGFNGAMPQGAPNPLSKYGAAAAGNNFVWTTGSSASRGYRIAASAVPEPSTIVLMSLGLAGLGFTRRSVKA